VIHPGHRRPDIVVMAIITGVGGIDMGRVFARRRGAIVTTRAGPRHTAVIKVNTAPVTAGVTILTGVGTGNMIGRLACSNAAVVTT